MIKKESIDKRLTNFNLCVIIEEEIGVNTMLKSKLYDTTIGLMVGDILGTSVDKNLDRRKGAWSDITAMTLCLVSALRCADWEVTESTYSKLIANFAECAYGSSFVPIDNNIGVGQYCETIIHNYKNDIPIKQFCRLYEVSHLM